ncbi:MAG: hypothetical protein ACLFST_09285, partial [Spirochaetia bacterium]
AYLKDVGMIKDILYSHEERSLLSYWAFLVWGSIIALGTGIHYVWSPAAGSALLAVWIPGLILVVITEITAWLDMMRKKAAPLFGRRFILFSLTGGVIFSIVLITAEVLYQNGLLSPGMIMILLASVLLIYILFSYRSLFTELYGLLVIGITILLTGVSGPEWYLAAGLFSGAVYIITGIHARFLEKKGE